MSDEPDGADAPETGDSGSGRMAVATEPATQPRRPTGKRQRAGADETPRGADGATTESAGTDTKGTKPKKAKKTKKGRSGPSRTAIVYAPFIYVYNFLKQVVSELRKVIWPNRKQMITYTSVVLAFLVFMVTLVAVSDFGLAKLVMLVFGADT